MDESMKSKKKGIQHVFVGGFLFGMFIIIIMMVIVMMIISTFFGGG